jgi:hypothetical protein
MNNMKLLFNQRIIALVLTAALAGCNNNGHDEDKDELAEAPDTIKTSVLNVKGELFSVPSPVQAAILIQKSGIPYNKGWLNHSNKVNTYSTDYSRALNLGIYGADLGYVSLFGQTQDALGYLASIKQLSDKIGVSSAFDAATMDRIKNNITNKDSMMVLVGLAYRASDAYLKDNKRTDISGLILAGGWIESLHFSVMALHAKPSDQLRYRIAEQKQALQSIFKLLGGMSMAEVPELITKLEELGSVYD